MSPRIPWFCKLIQRNIEQIERQSLFFLINMLSEHYEDVNCRVSYQNAMTHRWQLNSRRVMTRNTGLDDYDDFGMLHR